MLTGDGRTVVSMLAVMSPSRLSNAVANGSTNSSHCWTMLFFFNGDPFKIMTGGISSGHPWPSGKRDRTWKYWWHDKRLFILLFHFSEKNLIQRDKVSLAQLRENIRAFGEINIKFPFHELDLRNSLIKLRSLDVFNHFCNSMK